MAARVELRRMICSIMAYVLLAMLAATLLPFPLVAAMGYPCPIGQVWDDSKGRCAQCPVGTVKSPDEDGAEWATCESARLVCRRAEVAKYGSCYQCPALQVAVDAVKCANCPSGYTKDPPGQVSDATCKRASICRPQKEVCNGRDDDCDGLVDENLGTKSCGKGICYRTVPACLNGQGTTCRSGTPQREVCNGLDDDCNGSVDDLGTLSCGRGACYNTVPKCLDGHLQTCYLKPASKEVCDGIDNDCDGQVDDGIDDLYCTPCNVKVPGCKGGRPGTCDGVCQEPCCEDCANYSSPVAKLKCFSTCQDCKNLQDCLEWADSVGDKVAEVACQYAMDECGITLRALVDGGRKVTILQCYYAAYDQCTSRGEYYFANSDAGSACRYYYTGGGSCTATQFQQKAEDRLEELCNDVSIGIAVSLP